MRIRELFLEMILVTFRQAYVWESNSRYIRWNCAPAYIFINCSAAISIKFVISIVISDHSIQNSYQLTRPVLLKSYQPKTIFTFLGPVLKCSPDCNQYDYNGTQWGKLILIRTPLSRWVCSPRLLHMAFTCTICDLELQILVLITDMSDICVLVYETSWCWHKVYKNISFFPFNTYHMNMLDFFTDNVGNHIWQLLRHKLA